MSTMLMFPSARDEDIQQDRLAMEVHIILTSLGIWLKETIEPNEKMVRGNKSQMLNVICLC